MPAALARTPKPQSSPPEAPERLDAAGLRALAEAALTQPDPATTAEAGGRHRRGPFRPEHLISTRARRSDAMALRFYRVADVSALALLAVALAEVALPGPVLSLPLRALAPLVFACALSAWLLKEMRLYRFSANEQLGVHLGKLLGAFAISAGLTALLTWAVGAGAQSALAVTIWFALSLLVTHTMHACWWAEVRRSRQNGALTPNIVIVGATKHAERLINAALQRRDVNVLGVFDDRLARSPDALAGVPVLGDTRALLDHKLTPYVDRVVVALDPGARTRVRELVSRLAVLPNEVSLLVDLETEDERAAALSKLADAPLTRLAGVREDDRRAFEKRLQDMVIGVFALLILAPVMAVIALLVRLDSPGPVFFRQRRHGFNNETITVWKFRTMRHESADPTASQQVTADDARVTRLGKVLRKFSLDELPQLINVLQGEMSLVGPRPHAVGMKTAEVESSRLVSEYAWRHRMKPGMTGWAAIHGSRGPLHNAADVRRRVALDIEYIERQSFWLDLYVMAMTIPCLLGDRQAIR